MAGERDHMVCTACGAVTPIESVPSTCPQCDGILDLVLGEARNAAPEGPESAGIWRFAEHLPFCRPEHRITLGEGHSPLLAAPRLGAALGVEDLWIKNDSLQPSGSFKDRAVAIATSLAREYGREAMVLSSSGNAGASSAAYAARAGLPLFVLVPKTAPPAKLRQIVVAGARLVTVDGQTHDCCRLAKEAAETMGWVNLTTTYHNPYGVDGYATIAYELADLAPDVLLLPISSGPLLGGMMKGFERLKALGRIDKIPRPVAVQTAACAPIVKAYEEGGAVEPWTHRPTIASALNDTLAGYERDGDYTLSFIRKHDGAAVAVDDEAIVEAVRLTASTEGVVLEPSAAVPIAALKHARDALRLSPGDRVVAVTTGHGLKDLSTVGDAALPDAISPSFVNLRPLLNGST
ncbi:threonine synthase [Acuticoccus sp. M5D2P5]|uniref:threonine synthase n=1 Tax=Acuticoccus kalidii TaxID=2910977 RepID=UPI001F48D380|nr:threonine synthase [Acuticoccus kalidii]MCF3936214.1 threonine synthase [Acuticoccus kalidii]